MEQLRWIELMRQFGLSDNQSTYAELIRAYTEKHRHYHSDAHINACLQHFDDVQHLAENSAEVELALWFHDAIYKPMSSTNELDSANWCAKFLAANNIADDVIRRVHKLIMATCHSAELVGNDERLVVDIDLAILGAPEDIYQTFETNVRNEYQWVPSFIFKSKRKEILQGFLKREKIYHHAYFYELLEHRARENLAAAIALCAT
jgi:predicted metal-dependent HD superfamily phosphohydrolase